MFADDELQPISALRHLAVCERQWALVHLEQVWADNAYTVQGNLLHAIVDQPDVQSRAGVRIVHAMRLQCRRLGLTGVADVVEMHPVEEGVVGVELPGMRGRWRPYPIEYKRGRPKRDSIDEVQLTAQVLCLEEMLGVPIPEAAFFYAQPRRRTIVEITPALRAETEALATRLHELHAAARTPPAVYEKKCDNCSLIDICQPKAGKSASAYLRRALEELRAP